MACLPSTSTCWTSYQTIVSEVTEGDGGRGLPSLPEPSSSCPEFPFSPRNCRCGPRSRGRGSGSPGSCSSCDWGPGWGRPWSATWGGTSANITITVIRSIALWWDGAPSLLYYISQHNTTISFVGLQPVLWIYIVLWSEVMCSLSGMI